MSHQGMEIKNYKGIKNDKQGHAPWLLETYETIAGIWGTL